MKNRTEKISQLGQNWIPGAVVVTDTLTFPQCVEGFALQAAYSAKWKLIKQNMEKLGEKLSATSTPITAAVIREATKKLERLHLKVKKEKFPTHILQDAFIEVGRSTLQGDAKIAFDKFMSDKDNSEGNVLTNSPKVPSAAFFIAIGQRLDETDTKRCECSNFAADAVAKCLLDQDIREKFDILQVGVMGGKHNICVVVPKGTPVQDGVVPANALVIDPWARALGRSADSSLFVPWSNFCFKKSVKPFKINYHSGKDDTLFPIISMIEMKKDISTVTVREQLITFKEKYEAIQNKKEMNEESRAYFAEEYQALCKNKLFQIEQDELIGYQYGSIMIKNNEDLKQFLEEHAHNILRIENKSVLNEFQQAFKEKLQLFPNEENGLKLMTDIKNKISDIEANEFHEYEKQIQRINNKSELKDLYDPARLEVAHNQERFEQAYRHRANEIDLNQLNLFSKKINHITNLSVLNSSYKTAVESIEDKEILTQFSAVYQARKESISKINDMEKEIDKLAAHVKKIGSQDELDEFIRDCEVKKIDTTAVKIENIIAFKRNEFSEIEKINGFKYTEDFLEYVNNNKRGFSQNVQEVFDLKFEKIHANEQLIIQESLPIINGFESSSELDDFKNGFKEKNIIIPKMLESEILRKINEFKLIDDIKKLENVEQIQNFYMSNKKHFTTAIETEYKNRGEHVQKFWKIVSEIDKCYDAKVLRAKAEDYTNKSPSTYPDLTDKLLKRVAEKIEEVEAYNLFTKELDKIKSVESLIILRKSNIEVIQKYKKIEDKYLDFSKNIEIMEQHMKGIDKINDLEQLITYKHIFQINSAIKDKSCNNLFDVGYFHKIMDHLDNLDNKINDLNTLKKFIDGYLAYHKINRSDEKNGEFIIFDAFYKGQMEQACRDKIQLFREKYQDQIRQDAKSIFGFKKSGINFEKSTLQLEDILNHALQGGSRTAKIIKKLGWIDRKGKVTAEIALLLPKNWEKKQFTDSILNAQGREHFKEIKRKMENIREPKSSAKKSDTPKIN